jgi:hypothetical protein
VRDSETAHPHGKLAAAPTRGTAFDTAWTDAVESVLAGLSRTARTGARSRTQPRGSGRARGIGDPSRAPSLPLGCR